MLFGLWITLNKSKRGFDLDDRDVVRDLNIRDVATIAVQAPRA
jgi:hypothetical protein